MKLTCEYCGKLSQVLIEDRFCSARCRTLKLNATGAASYEDDVEAVADRMYHEILLRTGRLFVDWATLLYGDLPMPIRFRERLEENPAQFKKDVLAKVFKQCNKAAQGLPQLINNPDPKTNHIETVFREWVQRFTDEVQPDMFFAKPTAE